MRVEFVATAFLLGSIFGMLLGKGIAMRDLQVECRKLRRESDRWRSQCVSLEHENAVLTRSTEFYLEEAKKRGYKPTRVDV